MTPITARRITTTAILCALGIAAAPAAAFAEDPPAGEKLCDVSDPQLGELSGLAATGDGFYAITDGTLDQTQLLIHELDASCAIVDTITSMQDPADPEDLAVDADGVIWVADTGNNAWDRESIALHRVDPATADTQVYRFAYPDGAYDTEALLLSPDGTPIFATKENGTTTLFRPTAGLDQALDPASPLLLEEIGSIAIAPTETPGGPEGLGDAVSGMVTGGAVSPEGDKAVLRTYTDAYEWTVEDGDVAAALVDGEPTVTPLPDEPQGEAITYVEDGSFVTASEAVVDNATGEQISAAGLWTYQPTSPGEASDEKKDDAAPSKGFVGTVIDALGVNGILWVIAGIGFIGLIIFLIGLRTILKARKARKEAGTASPDDRLDVRADPPFDPRRDDDRYDDRPDDDRYLPEDRFDRRDDFDDRRQDDRYRDDHRDDGYDAYDDRPDDRRRPPVPRQYPDDGLGGGRLFDKPGAPERDDYDPRRHDEGNTGTVYGGGR